MLLFHCNHSPASALRVGLIQALDAMQATSLRHYKAGWLTTSLTLAFLAPGVALSLALDQHFTLAAIVLAVAVASLASSGVVRSVFTNRRKVALFAGFTIVSSGLALALRLTREAGSDFSLVPLLFFLWIASLFWVLRKLVGPLATLAGRI